MDELRKTSRVAMMTALYRMHGKDSNEKNRNQDEIETDHDEREDSDKFPK